MGETIEKRLKDYKGTRNETTTYTKEREAAISGIAECKTIHVDRERLENAVLSCTRTMAGMVSAEAFIKKKDYLQCQPLKKK